MAYHSEEHNPQVWISAVDNFPENNGLNNRMEHDEVWRVDAPHLASHV